MSAKTFDDKEIQNILSQNLPVLRPFTLSKKQTDL